MIDKVAGAAVQGASEVAKAPKAASFGKAMAQAKAPVQHAPQAQQTSHAHAPHAARIDGPQAVSAKPGAASLVNEVSAAQQKLDQILKMAESGRTFSPAELLA